jgi:hypothetical protein
MPVDNGAEGSSRHFECQRTGHIPAGQTHQNRFTAKHAKYANDRSSDGSRISRGLRFDAFALHIAG